MCLAILDLKADYQRIAFIRDEDRLRPTKEPGYWWPQYPHIFAGRDEVGGGTWFALDTESGSFAALLNRLDNPPPPAYPYASRSRGELPLRALTGTLDKALFPEYAPFLLLHYDNHLAVHEWDGNQTYHHTPGFDIHTITRHGLDKDDLSPRQALARTLPLADESDWRPYLDSRNTQSGHDHELAIIGVDGHPTFGTVGATLLTVGGHGINMMINDTSVLDPRAWRTVLDKAR
jgi:hypothetical protein